MPCVDAEIAYAAGLFDGEGGFSTSVYARHDDGKADGTRHHCSLCVGMQNLAALERFNAAVGNVGRISRRHDLWMLQINGQCAGRAAQVLLPYLTVKREQGALFIEFAATFSPHNKKPLHPDIVEKRRDLSLRIRYLMRADARQFRTADVVDTEPSLKEE